jgi:hypothetical protein
MTLPGYAADASLYRTSRSYRGSSGGSARLAGPAVVAQQLDCHTSCALRWELCNLGCAVGTGPLVLLCLAACGASFGLCLNACPPTGGGGGGPTPECGIGRRCCERDETGRCTLCVPNNAVCP